MSLINVQYSLPVTGSILNVLCIPSSREALKSLDSGAIEGVKNATGKCLIKSRIPVCNVFESVPRFFAGSRGGNETRSFKEKGRP